MESLFQANIAVPQSWSSNSIEVDPALASNLPNRIAGPSSCVTIPSSCITGLTSSQHSPNHLTDVPRKRPRRTKEQMRLFRLDQVMRDKEKEINDRLMKGTPGVSDANPPFSPSDYGFVCAYLEQAGNYDALFGEGGKIQGGRTITKIAAYELFARYLNEVNPRLHLTGRQLQQRWATYKRRFLKAKEFLETTLRLDDPTPSAVLAQKVEDICPFYRRLEKIFISHGNVALDNEPDSTNRTGRSSPSAAEHEEEPDQASRNNDANETVQHPVFSSDSHRSTSRNPPLEAHASTSQSNAINTDNRMMEENGAPSESDNTDMGVARQWKLRRKSHQLKRNIHPVAAFDSSSKLKFQYLEDHMRWEREKFTQELQFKKSELAMKERDTQTRRLLTQKWLGEGKNPSDILMLINAIYGT